MIAGSFDAVSSVCTKYVQSINKESRDKLSNQAMKTTKSLESTDKLGKVEKIIGILVNR